MVVPFNKSYYTGKEIFYIQDIIKNCKSLSGDGYYTKIVSEFIESKFSVHDALLIISCTIALKLVTHLIRLNSNSEVIMPSFTYISTANPVLLAGAKIVFSNINEKTLNIDPADIERKITLNTKAIYPVHYAGVACEMDTNVIR